MSKEDILRENFNYGFTGMEETAIFKSMEEYAEERSIGFAEWLHPDENGNHWQMYDGHDRWINLKTDEVLETKQLYQQYLNQRS